MYLFAHAFAGCLIGLIFSRISHDRRALPVCLAGAVLPDIIDKPLAILIPAIFGSSRTLGHTLLFVVLLLLAGLCVWRYHDSLLGIAFACAVFSHQFLDTIWNLPGTWYFPLLGRFPVILVPDYVGLSIWNEISTVSEWIFGCAVIVIIAGWYLDDQERHPMAPVAENRLVPARFTVFVLLVLTGIVLLIPATGLFAGSIFAPTYNPCTTAMAGILALGGAVVLAHEYGLSRYLSNLPA